MKNSGMWSRILIAATALTCSSLIADNRGRYEVWAIDQSNSPGKAFGGKVYIYNGHDLERGPASAESVAEVVDLGAAAADLCLARTGANPVRPHMIAMNRSQTHAVISFVASGHVLFMRADTRTPIECVRTTAGAGGARQVHFAIPAPDETYVAVANQNGKLFERIDSNFSTETFMLNPAALIDLANCMTPNGLPCQDAVLRPDNAPICPVIDSTSNLTFVTLRGGGLFVVNPRTNPMSILAEYDQATIRPNGCLGVQASGKMYIDSGGGVAGHLEGADLYAFPLTGYSASNPPNTPVRTVVFSRDQGDSHGATLDRSGRYLWVVDRFFHFISVVDTLIDVEINRISLTGPLSSDPTADLIATSPNGSHVFMSMRGPNPLTADPHVSTGSNPGVGVVKVLANGRDGVFQGLAPISNLDAGAVERADVHALTIRLR